MPQCDKCGQYFLITFELRAGRITEIEHEAPDIKYVNSEEHGESLKCTCPRCGYFWFVKPLDAKP